MLQRVFLVEPKQLHISRNASDDLPKKWTSTDDKIMDLQREVRSAGDGMEWNHDSQVFQKVPEHELNEGLQKPIATSTPVPKHAKFKTKKDATANKESKYIVKEIDKAESLMMMRDKINAMYKIELEELRSKESYIETINKKLIEEKLKLSTQLGIQSQVNTELKTLLVASVGEDLEEKLEKLTLGKATSERLIKKLNDQLEQRNEELEGMTIQSDVWRSKFLASKVMADELATIKAITDSRYRECSSALETLLQEHFQVATTIASANRYLLRLAQLTGCMKQEENISDSSSVDLAIANHSLAHQITHTVMKDVSSIKSISSTQPGGITKTMVQIYEEKNEMLSEGEKKAKRALENARADESEISKHYLDHNCISQILATKYPMRCLTCKGCKGPLFTV